ncbi:GNAT family N-acetyltransferase [Frigidibacter sp. ROC022]|uniref:GNAT family N-acetyltransferase n=1 Tax=Frigidibacter sp. ROC022 TaxID=2971796 RepID=UPI00215AD3B0|nr:GNAT family N-acetyltransferase [Frigidibacter sp. ROC022]MCR8723990.1 GNAT family N-acetyltransferase [Frigidibacter sp. ROC022]
MSGQPTPRRAVEADYDPLADLFHQRWHDAHGAYSPPWMIALRSRADLLRRLRGFGDDMRVIGPEGAPQGFCAIKGSHIDQIYVSRALEGRGAAAVLMRDGLERIAAAGHAEALLECNPGNARAAAFYRKTGWTLRGTETVLLDGPEGPFPFDCLIFTRPLPAPGK